MRGRGGDFNPAGEAVREKDQKGTKINLQLPAQAW